MLLTRGEVAYYGRGSDALSVFADVGFPCRQFENPADFLIDVIVNCEAKGDTAVLQDLISRSKQAMLSTQPTAHRGENIQLRRNPHSSSLFFQYRSLTQRAVKATLRTPVAFFAQIGQTIFMALLLGLLYLKISSGQTGYQDRIGYLYYVVMNTMFSYFPALALFIEVRF